jgi:hypothetical protein
MSLFDTIWDLDQDQKIKQLVNNLDRQEKIIEELARRVLILESKNNVQNSDQITGK